MTAPRTGVALEQIVYAALTSPVLTFKRQLPDASGFEDIEMPNVIPQTPDTLGDTRPDLYVCFAIDSYGATSREVYDRKVKLTFWVSAAFRDDCEEIYEAIRERVNLADQDAGFYATDLSRAASGAAMAAGVRSCLERRAYPCDFDKTTMRFIKVAEYDVVAF